MLIFVLLFFSSVELMLLLCCFVSWWGILVVVVSVWLTLCSDMLDIDLTIGLIDLWVIFEGVLELVVILFMLLMGSIMLLLAIELSTVVWFIGLLLISCYLVSLLVFCCYDYFLFFLCFEFIGMLLCLLIAFSSVYLRSGYSVLYMFYFMMMGTMAVMLYFSLFVDKMVIGGGLMWGMSLGEGVMFIFGLILFGLFVMVKLPMFPFSWWLTEAHVESSTEGSMLLAGVLLKLTVLFLFRYIGGMVIFVVWWFYIEICLLVLVSLFFSVLMIGISLDFKKCIAYLSIVHVNIAIIGLLLFDYLGVIVFIVLSLIHGISSSILFLVVGFMYVRSGSSLFKVSQSLLMCCPVLCFMFNAVMLSAIGYPLFFSFIGELGLMWISISMSMSLVFVVAVINLLSVGVSLVLLVSIAWFGSVLMKGSMVDSSVLSNMVLMFICFMCIFLTWVFV